MFYNFRSPNNTGSEEITLRPFIGVIIDVDRENYLATVRTNHGIKDRVRIPFPHYSRGSGIFIMPSIGDICSLVITADSESYMLAFYSLNPKIEAQGEERAVINPHTYLIRTLAGDSISVSKDSITPTIELKSKKDSYSALTLDGGNKKFKMETENVSIEGNEKTLDLFIKTGKITIKANDKTYIEIDGNTGTINIQGDIVFNNGDSKIITQDVLQAAIDGAPGSVFAEALSLVFKSNPKLSNQKVKA